MNESRYSVDETTYICNLKIRLRWGLKMDGSNRCPVIHGAVTTAQKDAGTTNRDWWPNQLNTGILRQNGKSGNRWTQTLITG